MDFGGVSFGAVPFGGNLITDADFTISLAIVISFPTDFVFFGEIGDVVLLPPGLVLPNISMHYRRSPCLLYEN